MSSGIRRVDETNELSSPGSAVGLQSRIILMRELVTALARYRSAPDARVLWDIRMLCQRAVNERWLGPVPNGDMLRAYHEGVVGCADRWLTEMASYEKALADSGSVLEAAAWSWARAADEGALGRVAAAVASVEAHAERLRSASAELAGCLEREAQRVVSHQPFVDGGTRRRLREVAMGAGKLAFSRMKLSRTKE